MFDTFMILDPTLDRAPRRQARLSRAMRGLDAFHDRRRTSPPSPVRTAVWQHAQHRRDEDRTITTRRAEGGLTLAAGALGMVAGAFAIAQGIALSPRLISGFWQLLLIGLPGSRGA